MDGVTIELMVSIQKERFIALVLCVQRKRKIKKNHYYPSRNWKHSDKVKIEKMDSQLKDLD